MDAYLKIAAAVLRNERRPLSPRAILATAYRIGIVPHHLYGRTQHKTLQARISEDIIARREHSAFFRTAPGRFFLREFITDITIPEEFRSPITARRRSRELTKGPALSINNKVVSKFGQEAAAIQASAVLDILNSPHAQYANLKSLNECGSVTFIRSFVCVHRDTKVLTYRLGRYRDDRDAFMSRRSIGFSTYVYADEHTLFSLKDFGIVDAGVRATKVDLDIPYFPRSLEEERKEASLSYFLWTGHREHSSDLLAIIRFECPDWFEPVKRRLALNDLAWMDIRQPVNDLDDFDPWSKMVLMTHYNSLAGSRGEIQLYPTLSR